MRVALLVVFAFASSSVVLFAQSNSATDETSPIEVSVDEVGNGLIPIGRLQKPLGTLMTVRGTWSLPKYVANDNSLRFTVTHVDGTKLADPVEFNVEQTKIVTKDYGRPVRDRHDRSLDGVAWTLRAFETGSVELMPKEYFSETLPFAVPYYYRDFTSRLNGILQEVEK